MEGYFMSTKEHQESKEHQEFFPENVEFLGFVGGWDCWIGVDAIQMLFYLIRTKDLDWPEAVVRYSGTIMSRDCVMSAPRYGSKREAAARLLDAHVRSRVHYEFPVPPYQSAISPCDTERHSSGYSRALTLPAGKPRSQHGGLELQPEPYEQPEQSQPEPRQLEPQPG
jgi:hypothetical protein